MTEVSAQVSVYPLGQADLGPGIEAFVEVLTRRGLAHHVGPMSTMVWGEDEQVFAALREGFAQAAAHGQVVMVVTISNACPLG